MASTVDKVKHALHLDKSHSTTHSHPTTTTGTTGHNTTGYGNSGTAEGVAGHHNSRLANAADPRIDSDLDGSRNAGVAHNSHTTGTGFNNHTTGTSEGVHGPHTSRLANAADPRIDSDHDGSRNAGVAHNSHNAGAGYTGSGVTGNGYSGSTNAGPHNSNIANKLDPRVDSDRDGSHNLGASNNSAYSGTHVGNSAGNHTGTVGGLSHSTNAGPHNSNLLNKADPRVDSDLDGRGNRHGAANGGILGASGSHATSGSGTAQNTAGPHNSDLLNQIDPRVDSDKDGSKTYGGNRTHA